MLVLITYSVMQKRQHCEKCCLWFLMCLALREVSLSPWLTQAVKFQRHRSASWRKIIFQIPFYHSISAISLYLSMDLSLICVVFAYKRNNPVKLWNRSHEHSLNAKFAFISKPVNRSSIDWFLHDGNFSF